MVMPDLARRYTVDDVLAFPPDGNRYELVDGELLVTPAPNLFHQGVLGKLYLLLAGYLVHHPELRVFFSPADISWDQDKLVQPDLFVVPRAETLGGWKTCRTLLLAVEVLSPGSARSDRLVKRRLYQRQQVATYWIVDPEARLVEVWHPGDERPLVVDDVLSWRATPEAAPLDIAVVDLFTDLPGPAEPAQGRAWAVMWVRSWGENPGVARLHVTRQWSGSMASSRGSKSSRDKVRAHRARLRRKGPRPKQIWVREGRTQCCKARAHRQTLPVARLRAARFVVRWTPPQVLEPRRRPRAAEHGPSVPAASRLGQGPD